MRRISLWMVSTVAAVILLFSYRTSTHETIGTPAAADSAQPPGVVATESPTPRASISPTQSSSKTGSSGSAAAVSVNGTVAQTRWGPVQVEVHISDTKITDVVALVYPSGNGHDQEINAYALPRLRQQVLVAQSAHIDGVSGATVTSDGYRESLQAALDAAHFSG